MNRDTSRKLFFDAWHKHLKQLPVEPLEAQVIEIILHHPEYHKLLSDPETYQNVDFDETNPFLHLGLHLALHEQVQTNRPNGITVIYKTLCEKYQDRHLVEHKLLECLAQILWDAQHAGSMPEESYYLDCLKKIK